MLYSEFLIGTGAKDNLYTYSEYQRIEHIYNNDNLIDKCDAYKLYNEPSPIISQLISELEQARTNERDIAYKFASLESEHNEVKKEWEKEKRLRISLQATIREATQQIHKAYYTLTD